MLGSRSLSFSRASGVMRRNRQPLCVVIPTPLRGLRHRGAAGLGRVRRGAGGGCGRIDAPLAGSRRGPGDAAGKIDPAEGQNPPPQTSQRSPATVRVTKPPARPVVPKVAASKPAAALAVTAPTDCAAVVASVVWPPAWRAICAGGRPGLLGLTSPTGTTTLYVRPGESGAFLRVVALHEAGHAWNFAHLDPTKIAAWCKARGCDATHFFAGGAQGAGWSGAGRRRRLGLVLGRMPRRPVPPVVSRTGAAERRAVHASKHAGRIPRLTRSGSRC